MTRGASSARVAPAPALELAVRARSSFLRRIGALLYEALLLVALALVVGFAFLPLTSPPEPASHALSVPPLHSRVMLFAALFSGAGLYYTWSWSGGRRTLPQKTWRMRIVDRAGHAPGIRTALIRYLAAWIGPGCALAAYAALRPSGQGGYAATLLALNYAWALAGADRQFLHDRIAGTQVVQDARRVASAPVASTPGGSAPGG